MQKYALKTFGIEFISMENRFTGYSAIFKYTANKYANDKSFEF